MAAVPILLRNKVIGVLQVYDDRSGRRFTSEDISLLDAIALQAANAIENSRLYTSAYESQTFMKAIIDQIPDPIFIKDREHRWVVVNTAFAEGILHSSEEKILGQSDYEFVPKEQADAFWEWDNRMFETGETQEIEEPITDFAGNNRILYTRKIPFSLNSGDGKADYLIGIINDITDRKQREIEREQLIEETRKTLERTQMLYRISHTLAGAIDLKSTFETVLGEYLQLLGLKQGSVMLYDRATNTNRAQARYIEGQPVQTTLVIPLEQDLVFERLQKEPHPLVLDDPITHPFTRAHISERGRRYLTGMLFIPLMIRGKLTGSLVLDATEGYSFNQNDIAIGEAITDQLNIWLENRQLLAEAQYRSERLQTAAEVSRAASSILDIGQLTETSVNLIRDQFNFYYVGLFLVDEADEWAVLKAGTGEAGRIQLEREHKLKIGGESMIGWSVSNRKARIALDVGEEAVRFRNPYLPDTHSEMALPLIALDKAIGALTVQSVERGAFSDEDITLLQTMADQLANAIENANLFSKTQEALAETEKLYRMAQDLSSAHDEQSVYRIVMEAISGTGIDASTIYTYVAPYKDYNGASEQFLEQKAVWTANGNILFPNGTRFKADTLVLDQVIPSQGSLLIEDIDKDTRLTDQLRHLLKAAGYVSLLAMPLSTYQQRLGFLLAAYKVKNKKFTKNQTRFFTTTAQQMVIALENLRLLDASQKRLRREEIIREISSKIRNATEIEDILKTTVTELSKVLGTSKGSIRLGTGNTTSPTQTEDQFTNEVKPKAHEGAGNKGNNYHVQ
jgi:PAS domain S-box-containing protein